jgi:mono/diheme cytochrome c family protein
MEGSERMNVLKEAWGLLALVFLMSLISCSSRRISRDQAISAGVQPAYIKGQQVFKMHCQKCHPNGEAGVGLSLNNLHLPGLVVRYRIRSRSVFLWTGKMPSFKKDEISRGDMDELIKYLKHMRPEEDAATVATR